jgi:hypothetical protein
MQTRVVGVPMGDANPQLGAEVALQLPPGDEVAVKALRSVISAAPSGVAMKRK